MTINFMDNSSWQLESLIKNAFERTKNRFLSYFLTWVAGVAMMIGVVLLALLAFGIIALIYTFAKLFLLAGIIGAILTVAATVTLCISMVYVSSWINLAIVAVLINDEKLGAVETYKKVRPLVWGYFWMNLVVSLFMIGLIPLGVLSLFVVYVLWVFWSSFISFVYLKYQKRGLENLWMSREMIFQRAWGIFGRMALISVAIFVINFLLTFGGRNNGVIIGLSTLFSIVTTPFVLCFDYEIFKNLHAPTEVKAPKVWVILSIVGGVIMLALLILAAVGISADFDKNKEVFLKSLNLNNNQKNVRDLQNYNNLLQEMEEKYQVPTGEFREGFPSLAPGAQSL